MFEVEVHNFQSIRHTRLRVDGFTAVLGKSNIGKSALVRAVQYALTNAAGTNFVRHALDCERVVRSRKKCKCSAKVTLRMPSLEVTWEKGDAVNRYTVVRPDAPVETFEGLDRGTPPFLQDLFPQVKVSDSKELIQIPDQFEPVFLLNCSGTAVASLLSDVARLDRINVAASMASKDKKDASAKRKVREADVAHLQTSLERYVGLDLIDTKSLVAQQRDLEAKQDLLDTLDTFILRARSARDAYVGLTEALKSPLPTFDVLEGTSAVLLTASRLTVALEAVESSLTGLGEVAEASLPDESWLNELSTRYLNIEGFMASLTEKGPAIKKLMGVERTEVPDNQVMELWDRLTTVQALLNRYTGAHEIVTRFSGVDLEVPDWDLVRESLAQSRLLDLDRWISKLSSLEASVNEAERALQEATELEASALRELTELGVCPTCDQPLGSDHRLHLENL